MLKKKFLLWLIESKLYYWFLTRVSPQLRFTTQHAKIGGEAYLAAYRKLKPGDWIFTIDHSSFSGKVITALTGGEVSHCGIFRGYFEPWECSEMTSKNFTKSAFYDMIKSSDRVIIAHNPKWTDDYRKSMVAESSSYAHAKYDYWYDMANKDEKGVPLLACSELLYMSDFERTVRVNLEDVAGIGRPYISPQGLLNSPDLFIIYDSGAVTP